MRWTPRHWLRRSFSALVAVWFVLVMVEPVAIHSCPVHGGHGSAHPAASAHASAPTHAGHDTGDAPTPGEHHAGCTCPGDCTAAGIGVAVPSANVVAAVRIASRVATGIQAHVSAAQPRAPFVLPFASGPPRLPRPA
jgi:hypothetical protein